MEEAIDFNNLSIEDLREEYVKLHKKINVLKEASEADAQKMHDLRRNLETANSAEAYLAQELEQITQYNDEIIEKKTQKIRYEYDALRKAHNEILKEHTSLQTDYYILKTENNELIVKLESLSLKQDEQEIVKVSSEQLERENFLQQENIELLAKIDESQDNITKFTMAIAEREKTINILQDEVKCLKENLNVKKEELEEKTQLLESVQDQVAEANSKIAFLTSAPDNFDRKGNSLFAEVDDQRQAMKELLVRQKKEFLEMKKIYNESEYEIRRLRRENIAMHKELQCCTSIFCNADKKYKQKLNDRIRQLLKDNEELENKLEFTRECLADLGRKKDVLWLDSMLKFCKQETEDLKKELYSIRIENSSLEEQLRNIQQEMAKWRFEGLKLRCILIDRENLLNENNIKFKKFTSNDIKTTEEELKNATPNIFDLTLNREKIVPQPTVEKTLKLKSEEAISSYSEANIEGETQNIVENSIAMLKNQDQRINNLNEANNNIRNESEGNISQIQSIEIHDDSISTTSNDISLKEIDTVDFSLEMQSKPSILVVNRDVFDRKNEKSVKFVDHDTADKSNGDTKEIVKSNKIKSKLVIRRFIPSTNNKPQ